MNVEKAAMKMELTQGWGKRMEEVEEAAKRDVHRLEGSAEALKQAAVALDAHRGFYQKQVDSGELTGEQCTLVMDVITRCVGGLQNLLDRVNINTQRKQGEVQAIARTIDMLGKDYKNEKAKVEAVAAAVESGEYDARPSAMSAADDIARRRAEAQAAKAPPTDSSPVVVPKKATRKKAAKKASRRKAD